MTTKYPNLFRPGSIAGLDVRNRVIKSPQGTATGNIDGTVSARTVGHYRRLGEGGCGLVMVEYTYMDEDASKSLHNQLGLSRREHVAGMGWLVDEVHSTGAKVGLQLNHTGRQRFIGTLPIKSASTSSWDEVERMEGNKPVAMTIAEIKKVAEDFGVAAARARDARFDLVEIHAGHGYLMTNFLSPFTNDRTDEYGGSFENRSRLLIEAVDAIRRAVPRDFPLSIRLSVTDYEPDGIPIEETVQLAKLLEEHGVDVIHASGGHHALMHYEVSPWYMPRALHRWGWEQIREAISIPLIASGSLVSPDIAEEILASGSADFVSLGRAMLADPDWANKARTGRELEIVPCIRCNDGCLHRGLNAGRSSGCTVNPELNEEGRYPITAAEARKSVAVVGGGPSGLRAAALLHDRGHQVTLFEPRELGGAIAFTRHWPNKVDLAPLVDHLIHEVTRRDIPVRAQWADTEAVADFDTVVIATGAVDRPHSVGIAEDANTRLPGAVLPDDISGPVVVIGGGFTGCEAALRIAIERPDVSVTLVEQEDTILRGDEVFTDLMMLPTKVAEAGVKVRTGARATSVSSDSVTLADGETLPASLVVIAVGRTKAETSLADDLREQGQDVVVIGSAQRPGRIFDAIHTAFFESRHI